MIIILICFLYIKSLMSDQVFLIPRPPFEGVVLIQLQNKVPFL